MKVVLEIPADHLARLVSASERKDPELRKFLEDPTEIEPREISGGARLLGRTEDPLTTLDTICTCFHLVVRKLRERHNSRPTLDVKDEYDVQDLLNAIMCMHFRDIRREEWVPSYAGKNSRADFLLKQERTVVETKMARNGLRDQELHDQLIVDIEHYKRHPDCDCIVCFVYDPEGMIKNPYGIQADLNRADSTFRVVVRIVPHGY